MRGLVEENDLIYFVIEVVGRTASGEVLRQPLWHGGKTLSAPYKGACKKWKSGTGREFFLALFGLHNRCQGLFSGGLLLGDAMQGAALLNEIKAVDSYYLSPGEKLAYDT